MVPAVTNQRALIPSEHEMMVFHTVAEQAVSSKMYKDIGEKSGVMMIMLAARELGIPPMQALNGGINIIQGKVEISARMMNALIRKAGHKIIVKQSTDTECILTGIRCDTGETQCASFSVAEAQKAGLIRSGGGWVKWPKDMCYARALSRLARQLFSDVIGIGYVEGEIKATDSEIALPEPEPEENEEDYKKEYLDLFDLENQQQALQYLEVVKNHFQWSTMDTLKQFLKDSNTTLEKFKAWRIKNEKEDWGNPITA